MKAVTNYSTSPYTSRQLLDDIYGPVPYRGFAFVRCACGEHAKFTDPNVTLWYCESQRCWAMQQTPALWDENPDRDVVVKWDGEVFEFFANRWWHTNFRSERIAIVRDGNLAMELDRRSGKVSARRPKPLAKLQPHIVYRGSNNRTRSKPKPSQCWCMSSTAHESFTEAQLAVNCPAHGRTCRTCGDEHG